MVAPHEGFQSAISLDMLSYAYVSAGKITSLIPDEFKVRHAEVIGWRPLRRLKSIVRQLDDVGIDVSDFHLRTGVEARSGFFDTVKILILQQLIHTADTVSRAYPKTPILLHAPEAEDPWVFRSLLRVKPSFVWIENHKRGLAGLRQAKRLVHLYRANRIPAAIMYDGGHEIGAQNLLSQREFRMQWDSMVAAKSDPDVWGEHVPISTLPDDGYPMGKITSGMWEQYAAHTSPNLLLRVVENQQYKHLIHIPKKAISGILRRNAEYYSLLQKTGVVNFQ